ncbi:MAG: esterase, partial [Bacteroidetes bacterium]
GLDDFVRQLKTFQVSGGNSISRKIELLKFFFFFSSNLWEAYAPTLFHQDSKNWNEHIFPLQTTEGAGACHIQNFPINTKDGLLISLQRFKKNDSKNVVLLIHGLTTSTDMFIMPEHYNLVRYLHDHGFEDVWSLDWRGSNRFTYNLTPHRFTVDDIAYYDMPKALEKMRKILGSDIKIHVICHCVGSLSFMSSLAAGWANNIASVISNSVSLTPKVPLLAFLKLIFAPDLIEHLFGYPYLSPSIPYFPGPGFGKWIHLMERTIRRECKEPACHMISFMWGWGFPVAYLHENLHPLTHHRLKDLFGGTSMHYYRHLRKMVWHQEAVSYKPKKREEPFPKSYLREAQKSNLPPILLVSGDKNLVFPQSNK